MAISLKELHEKIQKVVDTEEKGIGVTAATTSRVIRLTLLELNRSRHWADIDALLKKAGRLEEARKRRAVAKTLRGRRKFSKRYRSKA